MCVEVIRIITLTVFGTVISRKKGRMIESMAFIVRRQLLPTLPLTVVPPKASYLTSISLMVLNCKMEIRTSATS